MATDWNNSTSAKRAKVGVPEPLNPTEKDQRQKSPTNHALTNGITDIAGDIGKKSRVTHISKDGSNHSKHTLSSHSPRGGSVSPKGRGTSPKGGAINAKGGAISSKGGTISPKGGLVCPKNDTISPKGLLTNPKDGGISPKGAVKSPKSGSQSPRNNSQRPKGNQHSPRSRPHSPKGRPQSPKGGSGQQKVSRSPENNNHDGIYKTLHVDVDLANNKLTVSPVDGRRCHSDSRLAVNKSPRSIPPTENKKRKLEFTDIKSNKRTTPPGKKQRTDVIGNNSSTLSAATKQVDRTFDHNQNVQVVGSSKRRNSWDNSLHSPDQYKSDHSIGSRKAVLKVATYSDIILTSTRRSLPSCTASCASSSKGAIDIPGMQVEALDLSISSSRSPGKDQVHISSTTSASIKPQQTGNMVTSKPDIVVHGESETSSVESDPTDKYEEVDMDILFKKDAIAKTVMIESEHMDQEINSTADKNGCISMGDASEDGSDKDKRSVTPMSEGDDSAFSTDESKGNQPKRARVAKKYVSLQAREPRKRRMASLTAETKNLLLFEKDITAPSPVAKKSPLKGDTGRKKKRKESQTLQCPVSTDSTLLQPSGLAPSSKTASTGVAQGITTIGTACNGIRTQLSVLSDSHSSNSCLDKDISTNVKQTQSEHPIVPKPAESPAAKCAKLSVVSFYSEKKDIKQKDLSLLIAAPKKTKQKDLSLLNTKPKMTKQKDLSLLKTKPKKTKQKDLSLLNDEPKKTKQKDLSLLTTKPKKTKQKDLSLLNTKPKNTKQKDLSLLDTKPKNTKQKDLSLLDTKPKKTKQKDLSLLNTKPKNTKQTDLSLLNTKPKKTKQKDASLLNTKPKKIKQKDLSLVNSKPKKTKPKDLKLEIVNPKKTKQKDLKLEIVSPKKTNQKDLNLLITSPQKNNPKELTTPSSCKTPDTPPSARIVSSSPSKSAQLLLSRRATVDAAEVEKLKNAITSITSPLLLRMSRHSTDGTNSGDESLLPSPASGIEPLSISILKPGGILTGNFNGQSSGGGSGHYIPKSRVVKKIITPHNLKPSKTCRKHTNGWKAVGVPVPKPIIILNEAIREVRLCYESIKRKEDVIQVKDCVLLRSGVKRKDLPFVAKVSALWEDPESGEIMMSLLWYYRPEHTEAGRRPYHIQNELFACRHWDINSVACIEDKCYVLTPAEYNRYRKILQLKIENYQPGIPVVPEEPNSYPRQRCLPRDKSHPDSVFLCRQVYDFRQKRVLKNPY